MCDGLLNKHNPKPKGIVMNLPIKQNHQASLASLVVPTFVLSLAACQGASGKSPETNLEEEGKALSTIPLMTGPNTPAPLVASASSIYSSPYPAWSLFDGRLRDSDPHWISWTLPASVQLDIGSVKKVVGYTLIGRYDTLTDRLPNTWKLEGSNNASSGATATWVTLDQHSGVGVNASGWYSPACCEAKLTYTIPLAQYSSYRLTVTAVNGSIVADLLELQLLEAAATPAQNRCTGTAVDGTNLGPWDATCSSKADGYTYTAGDDGAACVAHINLLRAKLGIGPLKRWTEAEACTVTETQKDAPANNTHGSFGQCGEMGQNACPGWPSNQSVVTGCLKAMWCEGPSPNCPTWAYANGHYMNMTNPSYTYVACGFYKAADGSVWSYQNFK